LKKASSRAQKLERLPTFVSEVHAMASTEKTKRFGDLHEIGHLLDDWAEWVSEHSEGSLTIEYNEEDDSFLVSRDGRKAVLYTSDIDAKFYGDEQALFAEAEIGVPPQHLDWSQTLQFSGNELVLSRISLTERDGNTVLLVEGAVPLSKVDFALFDLLVREVATIARDLRRHLADVLETPRQSNDEEGEDGEDDAEVEQAEERASSAG
jgi:hypothetical protein